MYGIIEKKPKNKAQIQQIFERERIASRTVNQNTTGNLLSNILKCMHYSYVIFRSKTYSDSKWN